MRSRDIKKEVELTKVKSMFKNRNLNLVYTEPMSKEELELIRDIIDNNFKSSSVSYDSKQEYNNIRFMYDIREKVEDLNKEIEKIKKAKSKIEDNEREVELLDIQIDKLKENILELNISTRCLPKPNDYMVTIEMLTSFELARLNNMISTKEKQAFGAK